MSLTSRPPHPEAGTPDALSFYGPFLEADQIRRLQPEPSTDNVRLLVGYDYIQAENGRQYPPTNHGKFIFNALLASVDGRVSYKELEDWNFAPLSKASSRAANISGAGKALVEKLNKLASRSILELRNNDSPRSIVLADCVEIVRIDDSTEDAEAIKRREVQEDGFRRVGAMQSDKRKKAVRPTLTDPALLSSDMRWKAKSKCAGSDPGLFMSEDADEILRAKAICRGCEVRGDCLEHALKKNEKFGVLGGLDEKERRTLRKKLGTV